MAQVYSPKIPFLLLTALACDSQLTLQGYSAPGLLFLPSHANFPSVASRNKFKPAVLCCTFPLSLKLREQWTEGTEAALKRGNMASYQGDTQHQVSQG